MYDGLHQLSAGLRSSVILGSPSQPNGESRWRCTCSVSPATLARLSPIYTLACVQVISPMVSLSSSMLPSSRVSQGILSVPKMHVKSWIKA